MNIKIFNIFLVASASIALLNSCANQNTLSDPNVQTGAAVGAASGALIGYNTKGHHKGQRALIGGLLGAAAGGAVGSAVSSQQPQPQETGGWQ